MTTGSYPEFRPDGHHLASAPAGRRWVGPTLAVISLVLVAVAAALWWSQGQAPAPPPEAPAAPQAAAAPARVSAPEVLYPVQEAPPLRLADIPQELAALLGRKAMETLLETSDFPRRFAATVESLGREHSPPAIWPVTPIAGRFQVEQAEAQAVMSASNASRYTPLVALAESVDAAKVVDLYLRMYPSLQQAWRELGLSQKHLNDRVIEVIELLLATPQPQGPLSLQRTEIKGAFADPRPWVRWEFVDPRLQSLSAGQKMMLRMGPANARRAKAVLAKWRDQLVRVGVGAGTGQAGAAPSEALPPVPAN